MKSIKEELTDIIAEKRIYPVFQPIVSLKDGQILGYEGLSRIEGKSSVKTPEELFILAKMYGKTWQLEQICRKKILKAVYEKQEKIYDKKLFLNVDPSVMNDEKFKEGFTQKYLNRYGVEAGQIVFEIIERSAVEDMTKFKDIIEHYKKQSYGIAIDDAGSCYSGLNLICDIEPKYLKLDMSLVRDVDKNIVKYSMIKSLAEFAAVTSIYLIAEGIETAGELQTLIELGVTYGQGYFLRKPSKELEDVKDSALTVIKNVNRQMNEERFVNGGYRLLMFRLKSEKALRGYSEKYTYEKSEEIFSTLEAIVHEQIQKGEISITMDDFNVLAVVKKDRKGVVLNGVNQLFQKKLGAFYTEKELQQNVIKVEKNGDLVKYPLVSLEAEEILS